jgi:hypothetical protein
MNYEIPDPFGTPTRIDGFQHNFFTGEWNINCGTCDEPLDAPSKSMMYLIYKYHTKNECLGGW